MEPIRQFLLDNRLLDADTVHRLAAQAGDRPAEFAALVANQEQLDLGRLRRAFAQSFKKKAFYEILLEDGVITLEDVQAIVEEFGGIPADLGKILVERKRLTEEQAARTLARELGLEYVDLNTYQVDDQLFNSVDVALMRTYLFIPDKRGEKDITLIMANPGNVDEIEALEVKLGLPIVPKVACPKSIAKLLALMVETSLDSKVVFADLENLPPLEVVVEEEAEEAPPAAGVPIHQSMKEEAPVVRMVDSIILKAVRKRASDIHFEVYESSLKVKYRIDGVLFEVLSDVEPAMRVPIISRLKVMAQLDIAEKRVPQDGRFKLRIDDRFVDFRVSVLPSIFGETVVLRILDKSALGLDLRKVGLAGHDLLVFQRNILKPYGMVLVAGPTGSGKTTTLYSAIKFVHTPGDKFITIEDPVEYQLPDIVQIPVNEKKGLTFSSGLRSIVRQDPDKIMVGEIRDPETAKIAINAALTGHLVFSSIHANNVIDAISRLSNMEIDPYEFVSSFNLIMSQRLIRMICPNCKVPDDTITEEARRLTIDFAAHAHIAFQRGSGCRYCHQTGYQGRSGIFEVLEMSPQIKQMILTHQSPLLIRKTAIEQGMTPLRAAGWAKVERGETTFEEMNRVTFEEGGLE
ncbi:MAG: Type IV fimbrial assembly, ATPase PilB [Candidatus Ozemobacter sibiricus]|uniref:Type IV fimbrial assembly, ATPase PilB n=1 Tax=Candidatus Ozemobacter sibiricus TaxID=2268124 RepID=A0A367ZQY3_9BACT|nr:MAG: Type IV fimbrial assembly, ATPase PilB [Candidatus Ozemobacter sibiricus]